jgi:hypothetical protein
MALPGGLFDATLVPAGWFDKTAQAAGWYDAGFLEFAASSFPNQVSGLRYFHGTVRDLCMVAWADAPAGNRLAVRKNGVTYAAYLVPTTDPNASAVRVKTTAGIMAIRFKTGGDPLWSSVKLLLGFEGADGATSGPAFVDESPVARGAATLFGTAQIDTAQAKYGGSSLLVDGNSDGIWFADSADWAFGTSPYCVECWVRPNAFAAAQYLIVQWENSGGQGWALWLATGVVYWSALTTNVGFQSIFDPAAMSTGQWYHIAADFDGTTTRLFKDGVLVASTTATWNFPDVATRLSIGTDNDASESWVNGWVDEVRITKASRYTANFTPPDAPFPRGAGAPGESEDELMFLIF